MIEINERISKLKLERNAVFLVHVYQPGPIQELGDFVGDSLGLCIEARNTKADTIVFCGVKFMAESAKLLNPEKTVLLPDSNAGCPMADMAGPEELVQTKHRNPGALVVCYVNSTAAVKAESDICCTSSNAVQVIHSLPGDRDIIFVPDKHLGQYALQKCNRKGILWDGYCPAHQRILPLHIEKLKEQYPGSMFLAHPEAHKAVRDMADYIGSTGQIINYCNKSKNKAFIIGTELGIIYRLKKFNPDKTFLPASENAFCKNMKKITLEKIEKALITMKPEIIIEPELASRAVVPINKMLDL